MSESTRWSFDREEEVEPGHHYHHYLIGSRVYAGIFVGRYDDG